MPGLIISPTGLGIRMDEAGHGYYGASRGNRLHLGHDYCCRKGQDVVAPITGRATRVARPYANDPAWTGVEIVGERLTVVMFYLLPRLDIIGRKVSQGEVIGTAQAISEKYGAKMKDHIHLGVTRCDPTLLME